MSDATPKPGRVPTPLFGITTWLVAVALVFVAGFGMAATATGAAVASGLSPDRATRLLNDPQASPLVTSPVWIAATIVANEFAVAAGLGYALFRVRLGLKSLLGPRPALGGTYAASFLFVFGLSPLAQIMAELAYRQTEHTLVSETLVRTLAQDTSPTGFFLAMLTVALLPGFVEETLFRGLLMRCFERWGHAANLVVTSLLFALLHLDPSQISGTFVLGLGFGFIRLTTRSLWPCIASHAVYNAAVVAGARFFPAENPHAIDVKGAAFGLLLAVPAALWLARGRSLAPKL